MSAATFDTNKVTPAQQRVLRLTRDDGSLIIGGLDGRKVRKDVVFRLFDMGLLAYKSPASFFEHSEWVLTDKGKAAL